MNKEEILSYLRRKEVPLSLLYHYFKEHNRKKKMDMEISGFAKSFDAYLNTPANSFLHERERIFNKVMQHYIIRYRIIQIKDSNNQTIGFI